MDWFFVDLVVQVASEKKTAHCSNLEVISRYINDLCAAHRALVRKQGIDAFDLAHATKSGKMALKGILEEIMSFAIGAKINLLQELEAVWGAQHI